MLTGQLNQMYGEPGEEATSIKADFHARHCWLAIVDGHVQGRFSNEKCAGDTARFLTGAYGPLRGLPGSVVMDGGARL